jgi:hypothetical protein
LPFKIFSNLTRLVRTNFKDYAEKLNLLKSIKIVERTVVPTDTQHMIVKWLKMIVAKKQNATDEDQF